MSRFDKIDKNFEVKTIIKKDDIVFRDVLDAPFEIDGVFYENGKFRRMPEKVAKSVSEGVYKLHANTAGGRVRFKTDSPYVTINAKMTELCKIPLFALTGSIGFDLYVMDGDKERFYKSFIPPFDISEGYESLVEFETKQMRDITINFPLYSDVCELYIGLSEAANLESPRLYGNDNLIVYYGSSITQGGCASRPGISYQAIVSRKLDCDYVNLGFSGNARAEDEMIDYIKELNMSVFVYDYDHNAPTVEHLRNTHERMFKAIREKNPILPIVMMSRPKLYLTKEEKERLEIIKATYTNAKNSGDKNVYFIPGYELMKRTNNDGTVDGVHPNDFGFSCIAEVLSETIKNII